MADEFESKTGVYYGDMVNQDIVDAVRKAKVEAAALRSKYAKLSAMEKRIARDEIAAVLRLVEAVESL
ncbi:hypothetical protein [Burkholderia sp. BCC1998]|uniref:hypothetical protein n=1 Tax=Burkholderia sp. BCC1998 TaxID=2817447 RepID=UPI002AB6843B|nr:hypothetical protein [Burkholderia sp. BCC1998]